MNVTINAECMDSTVQIVEPTVEAVTFSIRLDVWSPAPGVVAARFLEIGGNSLSAVPAPRYFKLSTQERAA